MRSCRGGTRCAVAGKSLRGSTRGDAAHATHWDGASSAQTRQNSSDPKWQSQGCHPCCPRTAPEAPLPRGRSVGRGWRFDSMRELGSRGRLPTLAQSRPTPRRISTPVSRGFANGGKHDFWCFCSAATTMDAVDSTWGSRRGGTVCAVREGNATSALGEASCSLRGAARAVEGSTGGAPTEATLALPQLVI